MYLLPLTFLPQIIHIFKTREVQGVSFITFLGFNLIQLVSAIHGYETKNNTLFYSMIIAMSFSGIIVLQILFFKARAVPNKN